MQAEYKRSVCLYFHYHIPEGSNTKFDTNFTAAFRTILGEVILIIGKKFESTAYRNVFNFTKTSDKTMAEKRFRKAILIKIWILITKKVSVFTNCR